MELIDPVAVMRAYKSNAAELEELRRKIDDRVRRELPAEAYLPVMMTVNHCLNLSWSVGYGKALWDHCPEMAGKTADEIDPDDPGE